MASPEISRIESWMRCPIAVRRCESKNRIVRTIKKCERAVQRC